MPPSLRGREWYESALGAPRTVLAPMVDQSEHAWRVLCRRHGTHLCYSPMISSSQFAESEQYRRKMLGPLEGLAENEDLPLFVQFAGNDPDVLLAAAKHVEGRCSAVDINFGCPQKIAKRGHYGAWLMDDPQLQQRLVGALHCHLDCPVTVKIRVQEAGRMATVDYARMLQAAGASIITVHGRTRQQVNVKQGVADWDYIADVKAAVSVPVFANGGIFAPADVVRCLEHTKADGVMAGESLLENPALFEAWRPFSGAQGSEGCEGGESDEGSRSSSAGGGARRHPQTPHAETPPHVNGATQTTLAREYLALQAAYPSDLRSVKQHLFALLYANVQVHTDLRDQLHKARTLDEMSEIVEECDARPPTTRAPFSTVPGDAYTSWYKRHTWEAMRHEMKKKVEPRGAQEGETEGAEGAEGASGEREHENAEPRLSKGQRKRLRQQRAMERKQQARRGDHGDHGEAEEDGEQGRELEQGAQE